MDVNCNPSNQDEINLFDEQKTFVHSIFKLTFLTDEVKPIVRFHETDYDCQAVYKDLINYYTNLAKDSLTASSQLSYLTISRIEE